MINMKHGGERHFISKLMALNAALHPESTPVPPSLGVDSALKARKLLAAVAAPWGHIKELALNGMTAVDAYPVAISYKKTRRIELHDSFFPAQVH